MDKLIEGEKKLQEQGLFTVFPSIPDSYERFQMDNEPAIKWNVYHKTIGKITTIVITLKENYYYEIAGGAIPYNVYLAQFTKEQEKIFNSFLSTFRFIE